MIWFRSVEEAIPDLNQHFHASAFVQFIRDEHPNSSKSAVWAVLRTDASAIADYRKATAPQKPTIIGG